MSIEIKQLFREERFKFGWSLILLALYIPFGIVFAVLRMFIGLQVLLAAIILPHLTVLRSGILRVMCFVLGIVVREEGKENRDPKSAVILSNHVSVLDHIAVHILTGCVMKSDLSLPAPLCEALGLKNFGAKEAVISNMQSHIGRSEIPILIHPEGATTTSAVGLLKFEPWPLEVSRKVQPVSIRAWRPPLTDVAVNVLASTYYWDIFFFLFVPFTVFTVKYLSAIELPEGESAEEGMAAIEAAIADDLGIKTTKYTCKDKEEHEKRYLTELYRISEPSTTHLRQQPSNQQLLRMSHQVKEVLPHVPLDAIRRDLLRTWDIDSTITNILEGLVPYVPELQPVRGSAQTPPTQVASSSLRSSQQKVSVTPVSTAKPSGRAMTFQERKTLMIEEARKKYIEKHGLKIANM